MLYEVITGENMKLGGLDWNLLKRLIPYIKKNMGLFIVSFLHQAESSASQSGKLLREVR